MNSNSERTIGSNNSLKPLSQSFNLKNIFLEQNKYKVKNTKNIQLNNRLYEHQRKKGDFKYLQKYVHKHFISFYKNSKNDYNIRMIEDILNNESTHLVAEFKDYLIMGDITEFLQKSYNIKECKKYLPKIYEYYNSCSVIFPNYVNLQESKYIYKNIRKKQKVIDNQQEQEEKQEKIKKGNLKLENNEDFFTTKTFNSILEQTNTSNVRLFFGLNDAVDANETPNDIVDKLEKAEKEAIKKKINLVKTNKNSRQISNILETNNSNLKMNNSLFHNNSKIYNKNKPIKERNKNNNNNIHYLTGVKKKNNIKLNPNQLNNANTNTKSNLNINSEKVNKIQINNYVSKNQQYYTQNPMIHKRENTQKNYIKTYSNITDTENENTTKNNFTILYGNSITNSKKKEIRKFLIDNSRNKHQQIYFRNINRSNKNIKKQLINSLFPSKSILNKLFNNGDNNHNNSALKHNSFNLINKKSVGKNNGEANKQTLPLPTSGFSPSPSSITIQTNNPFRNKKNYNININIKESNSTRNIISNKKIEMNKSKEKLNLKSNPNKIKRNKIQNNNQNNQIHDYNSNTITTSNTSKNATNKEKIKYIHKNKNFVYNKAQMSSNHQIPFYNNYSNYRTLGNNSPNKKSLNNESRNNFNSIKNINNINNTNNYMINNLNIHKINSTSNIQKPMNMNININMNNSNKNKIYFNDGSYTNLVQNKVYSKSPLSIELETIKVTKKKRTIYPKNKLYSDISNNINYNNKKNIYTNYNTHAPNNNANTLLSDKNYYIDSINHTTLNTNNLNEEINNGFNPNYNNNYPNNVKKHFFLDELYRKKNIILPFNKEINNINININGYNPPGGSLTSRTSNNVSKKKYKRNNGMQEINLNNYDKVNSKNKVSKKNNNNLMSRNEGNPVKIKKAYDSLKNSKNFGNKNTGYLSARKK